LAYINQIRELGLPSLEQVVSFFRLRDCRVKPHFLQFDELSILIFDIERCCIQNLHDFGTRLHGVRLGVKQGRMQQRYRQDCHCKPPSV
jgi:hypothetical protein